MAEPWTDDRLDAALLALADELDVPSRRRSGDPAPRGARGAPSGWRPPSSCSSSPAVVAVAPGTRGGGPLVRCPHRARRRCVGDGLVRRRRHDPRPRHGVRPRRARSGDVRRPPRSDPPTPPARHRRAGSLLSWRDGATTLWVRAGRRRRRGRQAADRVEPGRARLGPRRLRRAHRRRPRPRHAVAARRRRHGAVVARRRTAVAARVRPRPGDDARRSRTALTAS